MKAKISLWGCDDSTHFELLDLSERDLELLSKIQELSKKVSEYSCMPILEYEVIS